MYNAQQNIFELDTPTDLSIYSQDDIEHVGWYYEAVESGEPIWLAPYHNENIDVFMVSYVIPIFIDDLCIGVVGMDIDFTYVERMVNQIKVLESGYGVVLDEKARIMIHPKLEMETYSQILQEDLVKWRARGKVVNQQLTINGIDKSISIAALRNGMYLLLTAPRDEIFVDSSRLSVQIILMAILCIAFVVLVAFVLMTRMLMPNAMDTLTGVYSRAGFILQVRQRMAEGGEPYAFVMTDIDHFKRINDTMGHVAGDIAIQQVARTFQKACNTNDLIGRFGGDEFLIFMQCPDAAMVVKKLKTCMELLGDGGDLFEGSLECSMGVVYSDDYACSVEELLEQADEALYRAKALGRNRYEFYEVNARPI